MIPSLVNFKRHASRVTSVLSYWRKGMREFGSENVKMSMCNAIPVSSCMYTNAWSHKDVYHQWTLRDDLYSSQITAPGQADVMQNNKLTKDERKEVSRPLMEKNTRKNSKYIHVPHRDKPPQVVARRNARERRRVQAVNSAFMRLRKAVPLENSRGKRISKVKTLQNAIEYIQRLELLLEREGCYQTLHYISSYNYESSNDFFGTLDFEDDY